MKKGFTLIEFLVVMGIVVFLAAIVLPGYQERQAVLALQRAATKLAQDIRAVQEMAMSTREFNGEIPSRYGIFFHSDNLYYIVFVDQNDDGFYHPSDDDIVSRINYEEGINMVRITDGDFNCYTTPPHQPGLRRVHIAFSPPNPVTQILIGHSRPPHASTAVCSEVTITLRFGQDGPSRSVRVNEFGLIEVR